MQHFVISDTSISSQIPFPELAPGPPGQEGFTFSVERRSFADRKQEMLYHWIDDEDGSTWATVYRDEDHYHIDVEEFAIFSISPARKTIACSPKGDVPIDTIRHLLLDQILPAVLSLDEESVVLHASAVMLGSRAVAFVGERGAGKSTTAAALTQRGARPLTDDCLVIKESAGQLVTFPYYPGLRLWEDGVDFFADSVLETKLVAHYTEKFRALFDVPLPADFYGTAVPLAALFVLDEYEESKQVEVVRTPGRKVVPLIRKYAHLLAPETPASLQKNFELLADLASLVPVFELHLPSSLDHLPEACDAIGRVMKAL